MSATVYDTMRVMPAVRHVSHAKLQQVSRDIAIVALKIRSAYLFDAFALRDRKISLKDLFTKLLTNLREAVHAFQDVSVLHDSGSEQLFFISVPILATSGDRIARQVGLLFMLVQFVDLAS
ncbi:hypothetical protein C8Q76DRAFT_796981 [Earliella scabrosa]|nr:hypothetical protein C8Q76DRAFT_796981 [Earliella scabrosa]